jgi:hypothetical protein
MSSEKEAHIRLINANIKEIISDMILRLDCEITKKQSLTESLSFLADIAYVYSSNN